MDGEGSAIDSRFENRFPDPDLPSPKTSTKDDAYPLLGRVRKALAYCRKCTLLSRTKSTTGRHEDIGLKSMSSTTSTSSHRPTHRLRPTLLDLGREGGTITHTNGAESSHYSDCDPFITSPTWFREEYFEEETRP